MASGVTSKTFMWGLMGLLILGLGGFGVSNLSGNIRNVGSVGDIDITVDDYARALQEDIRAVEAQTGTSLTFDQIEAFGIDGNVLGRLIGQAALDNEAQNIGLSIGDENLSRQIVELDVFQGPNGFDREAYKFQLDRIGMTEAKFEEQLRADSVRGMLQSAVVSSVSMPDTYAKTLVDYAAERRNFTWARLSATDLVVDLPEPSEEDLIAYHKENAADFTTPEVKRITYAWLSPDDLVADIPVEEDRIRALYESRGEEFNTPERRLVERLIFSDLAAGEAAKVALERNETDFETLVAARGLELQDVDMGDVAQDELGTAGGAVFNADVNDVVGPFETSLGPALFRINGVLQGQSVSLEDVRAELQGELASDAARRKIETVAETVDDLLAGGATLEELLSEADMKLSSIDWHADAPDPIAAYSAFRDAAETVQPDDYPAVIHLDDGGIVALRLEQEIPAKLQDLNSVRSAVIDGWLGQARTKALADQAQDLVTKLVAGEDMAALGLTAQMETDITRDQFIPDTDETFLDTVFEMKPGDVTVISATDSVAIVRLDDVLEPDQADAEVESFRASLLQQAGSGMAQDIYAAYARSIQSEAGIQLDQTALNAVHANFR
ncbi:Peptidyl-prolyl cis-trans isomerase D [Thalassovita gelatinovora]|uniref:Peptidyl-prolyl cis-trans isomerase D n=1 Tax=Thalassovita gelatinovora TaxID=53501 RepID=A0A0P1F4P7_THAGE|nr:peptidylprolyl isomerase [Thalassovita gelatinovora]CUH62656.1 Peptidyl-prolyl cis-trans isomerase D [Thalassovita gelatinovora]SEQ08055.1 peptidyl-prolyl cis-trans isomerase D [Thalassovita gelatinovora]